jgi:hypothetical protein
MMNCSIKQRPDPDTLDEFAESLMTALEDLMRPIFSIPEMQDKVMKLVGLWKARNLFPQDFLDNLEQVRNFIEFSVNFTFKGNQSTQTSTINSFASHDSKSSDDASKSTHFFAFI